MKKIFTDKKCLIALCAIFCAFVLFYALLPYADDDWDWGTQGGIDRLLSGFADYNGRYLGNLLILLITRAPLLKALLPAIACTLLCALPAALCGGGLGALLLSTLLFTLMSTSIARQTVFWFSGFLNYGTGTLCLVALLYLLTHREAFRGRLAHAFSLVLCVCGCLFMEHVTFAMLLLALTVFLHASVREHAPARRELMILLACLLGALIMFSNGAYANILGSQDFYRAVAKPRSLTDFLFDDCYKAYYYLIYPNLFRDQAPTLLVLGIVVMARFLQCRNALTSAKRFAAACCAFVLFAFPTYLVLGLWHTSWEIALSLTYPLELLASLVYVLSLVVFSCLCLPTNVRFRALLTLATLAFLCAPLVAIAPVNARNFLPMHLLVTVFTINLAVLSLGDALNRAVFPLGIAAALTLGTWVNITARNYQVDRQRIADARAASDAGKQVFLLPHLPYEEFMWESTPHGPYSMTRDYFRLFYGLHEDLQLEDLDYQSYYEMRKAQ